MWTIDEHIQKDEKILYIANPVWIGYFTYRANFWFFILTIWTIIIPIFLILISYLSKSSTIYAITDKRVIGRQGIISENFKSLTFEHITSIRVKRGILGKMFDFGDIIMYPSGINRMYWAFVKNPVQVKNEIEKHFK